MLLLFDTSESWADFAVSSLSCLRDAEDVEGVDSSTCTGAGSSELNVAAILMLCLLDGWLAAGNFNGLEARSCVAGEMWQTGEVETSFRFSACLLMSIVTTR